VSNVDPAPDVDPVVAVVDDESLMRAMLRRMLRLADYRVAAFASGEEFLNSFDAGLPACAVLDVQMPGLTGFEVQARMRGASIWMPVVFITASDDATLDRLAFEAGAVCLLRKPFSGAQLLEAVGLALGSNPAGTLH
jgi:FixJ family two-component response regulator